MRQRIFSFASPIFLSALALAGCASSDEKTETREPPPPDEVKVDGQTLQGRVVGFGPKDISFDTKYGEGTIEIPYEKIEEIRTDGPLLIIHEPDNQARGRVWGLEAGQVVIGPDPGTAKRIPTKEIISGLPKREFDDSSILARLRRMYPYWQADFEFGLSLEQSQVNERKLTIATTINRRKEPTRFGFDFRLALENKQDTGQASRTTKDEFRAYLRGEHDVAKKVFTFAYPACERDAVRNVEFRFYPTGGVGYRFFDDKDTLLQLTGGLGYVWEKFGSIPKNDYLCGQIGAEYSHKFGPGIVLSGFVNYLPGIPNVDQDWLLRTEVNLLVPIVDPLAVKLGITHIADNNPTPDTGNNKLVTFLGLALVF